MKVLWAGVALAGLVVAACGETEPACYAGDYVTCTCTSGATGFQECNAAGDGYGFCVCDGHTPGVDAQAELELDAGNDGASEAEAGGLLAFMAPCATDEQCVTGLCFPFPSKGPHCDKPCKTSDECPPPSDGCNPQGVCKAP